MIYNYCGGRTFKIAIKISIIILLIFGNIAGAAIITVPDDFLKIQWAIDNATTGDKIEVHGGTYFENVNINKQLTLRGIGNPVVDAFGNGSAIMLTVNGITIEGFTVTGASSFSESGIKVTSDNNTLSGNNASNNNQGISLFSSNNNKLIKNNASSNYNNGIYLSYSYSGQSPLNPSNNNMLIGNKATYNSENGIYINSIWSTHGHTEIDESYNTLNNNTVSNNGNGIYLASKKNTLIGNNASNNIDSGIYINTYNSRSGFAEDGENTLSDNTVSNNGNGIYLFSKKNTLTGNNASNNTNNGIYICV